MNGSVRPRTVRLISVVVILAFLGAGLAPLRAFAQDSVPHPPPPLRTAQVPLPPPRGQSRDMAVADSVWPANAELLNQALSPYRLNLAGLSETQRKGLGRAAAELLGAIDFNVYRLNSLQAAAIVFYGLTVYGGDQVSQNTAAGPCPGPVDCGEPIAKLAELIRYAQRLAQGFTVLHPSEDGEILDYFYNTAVSLDTGFGRCGCGAAAGASQRLRDGARALYSRLAIFPSELRTIVELASTVQGESDACLRR